MTDLAADTRKVQKSWKDIDLRAVAPFLALALLLVLGAIANPNFISIDNLLKGIIIQSGGSQGADAGGRSDANAKPNAGSPSSGDVLFRAEGEGLQPGTATIHEGL